MHSPPHLLSSQLPLLKAKLKMASNPCHVRSISLPSRSHPLAQNFDEELHKMKTWAAAASMQPTSEALHEGLVGLANLYCCVENLLRMPQAQTTLSHHRAKKLVSEELDGSVNFLDICSSTRGALSLIKESAQDLQSTLRMRGLKDQASKVKVHDYMTSRKKADKEIKVCLKALRKMEEGAADCAQVFCNDESSFFIVTALKEAKSMTSIVFQSVLAFFAKQKKTSGWRLILNKGRVACEGGSCSSEVEKVDVLLQDLANKMETETIQEELKALKAAIDGIDMGLECMFQKLIQMRVSLLNIVNI